MFVAWVVAWFLAWDRIAGDKSQAFQAVAHLFLGFVACKIWSAFDTMDKNPGPSVAAYRKYRMVFWNYMAIFWGLTVVEVSCFIYFKYFG